MKNKRACVLVGCLICVFIAIVFYAGLILLIKAGISLLLSKNEVNTEEYVVIEGQTLWDIATENKKDGQDIREYVYQLRELNNIDDCIIRPGQELKIIK